MSQSPRVISHEPHPAMNPGDTVQGVKSDEAFDAELSAQMVKRTAKLNDNTLDLAVRLKEARDFMAWSNSHLRGVWLDWMDQANTAARDMNQFRMAFERESKTITATAKDVAQFFNSAEYVSAHQRLAEMVTLLDRFATLKQNGTLDAFADFILKIQCK